MPASQTSTPLEGVVLDDAVEFDLPQLSAACTVQITQIVALVEEGVLEPAGRTPGEWRFSGLSLVRARRALRLQRDFELNAPAAALVLELLDQIDALRRGGR